LPPWRVVSDPGAALTILEGPDPMFDDQDSSAHDQAPARDQAPRPSPPMLRWLLIPASGQLVRYPPADQDTPTLAPRPALVVHRPLPQHIWQRKDYDFVDAQLLLPPRDSRVPLQPRLVGLWDEMQLDPRVWGLPASAFTSAQDTSATHPPRDRASGTSSGTISLLDMTVKSARLVFAHRLASSRSIPGFVTAGAAFPRIWRTLSGASPSMVVSASTPDLALRALGLEGLEERWRRGLLEDDDLDTWPMAAVDQVPTWLDLQAARDTSARDARAAARSARAAQIASQHHQTGITISASATVRRRDGGGAIRARVGGTRNAKAGRGGPAQVTASALH